VIGVGGRSWLVGQPRAPASGDLRLQTCPGGDHGAGRWGDQTGEQAGDRVAGRQTATDGVEKPVGVGGLGDDGHGPQAGVDCPAGGTAGLGNGHVQIIGGPRDYLMTLTADLETTRGDE
jgi:hypothetical protein